MALVPMGERTRHKALAEIERTVHQKGTLKLEIAWRNGDGPWQQSIGEVSSGPNGLIWQDVQGEMSPWPPQVSFAEIREVVDMVRQTAHYAEEAINFATAQGQEATIAIASSAMNAVENAHANLANIQQYHFEGYETARDRIEKERLELAKWETRLEEQMKDLGKREADLKKAGGAEKERLQAEFQSIKDDLDKQRRNLLQEKREYMELLEEATSAKRKAEKDRIKQLLRNTEPTLKKSSLFPKTSSIFPKRNISFPESDSDTSDSMSFNTVKSFTTTTVVESDAFAFEPTAWKGHLTPISIERLLQYLRKSAACKQGHWSEFIVEDIISTLRGLCYTYMEVPALGDAEHFVGAMRTLLKRIFIFKETSAGHGGAYIKAFSEAVDGAARPSWITQAQRQARKDALPSAPARSRTDQGKGKGKSTKN